MGTVFGAHGVTRPTIRVRKVGPGNPLPAAMSKNERAPRKGSMQGARLSVSP